MNLLTHRPFSLEKLITAIALLMAVFHLYVVIFIPFPMDQFKNFNIMFSLVIFYLIQLQKKDRSNFAKSIDVLFIILSLIVTLYVHFNYREIAMLMGIMDLPSTIMGTILLIVVWESARRFWGWLIPIFVLIMLLYAYFGKMFPDPFYHGGVSFERIIGYSTMFFRGIYGRLTGIGASLVFPLFIFANLLDVLGGRQMFLRAGKILASKFKSGPAQGAVLCSLFMGSISGSAAANVATTGSFTIPMMKSAGYKSRYAAAVESVASTGGQFMPPIMGSTAFVMVGITAIPYGTIALAALLPAVLFYFFVSFSVELRAHKDNVSIDSEELVDATDSFKKVAKDYFHLILAAGVMIYLLAIRYPPSMSVVYGILCLVLFVFLRNLVEQKDKFASIKELGNNTVTGLVNAAKVGAPLFLFFALVNVAIEMLVVTGLAQKFSHMLIGFSGGNLFLLLVLTAITCVIFGMGMPSASAYILVALLGAPALVEAGTSFMAAHLFVYFIAVLSAITPPIAIAPMVASGIAKCEFWPAALTSVRLGLPGFILPFYFMYRPELLIIESSITSTLVAFIFAATALISLSMALEGFYMRSLRIIERAILILIAGLLMIPDTVTSVVGGGFFLAFLIAYYLKYSKRNKVSLGISK